MGRPLRMLVGFQMLAVVREERFAQSCWACNVMVYQRRQIPTPDSRVASCLLIAQVVVAF